jgi:hypothetical protein
MTHTIEQTAGAILSLINSKPRNPNKDELAAVIAASLGKSTFARADALARHADGERMADARTGTVLGMTGGTTITRTLPPAANASSAHDVPIYLVGLRRSLVRYLLSKH